MSHSNYSDDPAFTPWALFKSGFVMIGVGVFFYFLLGFLEERSMSVRLPIIIVGIYDFLGRLGILAIFSCLGLITIIAGIVKLIRGN